MYASKPTPNHTVGILTNQILKELKAIGLPSEKNKQCKFLEHLIKVTKDELRRRTHAVLVLNTMAEVMKVNIASCEALLSEH